MIFITTHHITISSKSGYSNHTEIQVPSRFSQVCTRLGLLKISLDKQKLNARCVSTRQNYIILKNAQLGKVILKRLLTSFTHLNVYFGLFTYRYYLPHQKGPPKCIICLASLILINLAVGWQIWWAQRTLEKQQPKNCFSLFHISPILSGALLIPSGHYFKYL